MHTTTLLICVLPFVIISATQASITVFRRTRAIEGQKYTSKYDNIDVDRILASKRLLFAYINCILDKKPCTPDGRELKNRIPDALATDCAKCTEAQKNIIGRVMIFILQNYKDTWKEITAKYDPDDVFLKKYEGEADYEEYDEAK